jgi:hypothetical protein
VEGAPGAGDLNELLRNSGRKASSGATSARVL